MPRDAVLSTAVWMLLLPSAFGLLAATPSDVVAPPPFEQACFDDFNDANGFQSFDRLRKILEPVRKYGGSLSTQKASNRPICQIAGMCRLNLPWRSDSVLRISLMQARNVKLYFWSGREGVLLHCNTQQAWAAYGTTRRGSQPQAETFALWAVDGGRYCRCRMGTVEMRCQDGKLVLTRGDLVLLCVPFNGLPREVFLDAEAKIRGLEMVRSGPAPLSVIECPSVFGSDTPAELQWQTARSGGDDEATLNRLPDGCVELTIERKSSRATTQFQAATKIGPAGLYEYIFEIEDPQPGTGVYLGDEDGKQLCRVVFFVSRNRRDDGHLFFGGIESGRSGKGNVQATEVVPYAGRHQWLKIVAGAAVARYYVSGDGAHWSEALPNASRVTGPCTTVGLFAQSDVTKASIKLRCLKVRRLDLLSSLVGPESEHDVQTLIENENFSVCQQTLYRLIEEAVIGQADLDLKLRLLDEAGMLAFCAKQSDWSKAGLHGVHYERLGALLLRQEHPAPLTTISRAIMRSSPGVSNADPFLDDLLRHELLGLAYKERWREVAEFCRRVKYWMRLDESKHYRHGKFAGHFTPEATIQLINWAAAQAALHERRLGARNPGAVSNAWRHPLIENLSKESYNVLAELEAALENREYREACRIISGTANPQSAGLLPDGKDRRLLVSFPMTIQRVMRQVPQLGQVMRDEFASRGMLRIRQAMADGDGPAVEATSLRFFGTEAAAEAHRWLGDRNLSAGLFSQASGHYAQALQSASASQRDDLSARLRLAAAMMGRDVGDPITVPVRLGEVEMPAGHFERLVAQMRQTRRPSVTAKHAAGGQASAETGLCPRAARFDAARFAQIELQTKEKLTFDVDWLARHTAAVFLDGRMIVTGPGIRAAFDLDGGRQRWLQRDNLEQTDPGWLATPMLPTAEGGRIFVRRPMSGGSKLACFDAAKGKLLWNTDSAETVICDPLIVGEELLALTARHHLGGQRALSLSRFDPNSGQCHERLPLAEFRDLDSTVLCGAMAVAGDKIVASVGGAVLCCDLLGRVAWIRRQIWVPPPSKTEDAGPWFRQRLRRPLVAGSRVYVTQPGVWAMECLDLETGAVRWRRGLPRLTSPLGYLDGRLILETTAGLTALRALSGRTIWRHDAEDRLAASACGRPGGIVYAKLEPRENAPANNGRRPVLVWVDPKTGRTARESVVDFSGKENALLGPLITDGRRQWVFAASADNPSQRKILELVKAK